MYHFDFKQQARHRFKATKANRWIPFTVGHLLVFLGIILACAGMGLRKASLMWSDSYCTRNPWVQNAMTATAFRRMRSYLSFIWQDGDEYGDEPEQDPRRKKGTSGAAWQAERRKKKKKKKGAKEPEAPRKPHERDPLYKCRWLLQLVCSMLKSG